MIETIPVSKNNGFQQAERLVVLRHGCRSRMRGKQPEQQAQQFEVQHK
jgi:hypothetical protein